LALTESFGLVDDLLVSSRLGYAVGEPRGICVGL
jgi:hypothetical protein